MKRKIILFLIVVVGLLGFVSSASAGVAPHLQFSADSYDLTYGAGTTIYWNPLYATSCMATDGTNGWAGSKSTQAYHYWTGPLYEDVTFTLTCSNSSGNTTKSFTIEVASAPIQFPSVDLFANSYNLQYNGSTTLYWVTDNASTCYGLNGANGWATTKPTQGSATTGNLTQNTTFTLECTNSAGTASDSVTINVAGAPASVPTVNVSANPSVINSGSGSTITWSSVNATTCYGSGLGLSGTLATSGSQVVYPTSTTTYTVTCTNSSGNGAGSATVSVNQINNTLPSVSTNSATNVSYNSATLNGYVSSNGGTNVYTWFQWGTNTSLGNQTNQTYYGSTSGANFSYALGGLSQDTTYYFRAVAQNGTGQIVYGNTLSFTTSNNFTPTNQGPNVTTYPTSAVGETSITLNGYLSPNGLSTERWFDWGTNPSSLINSTSKNYQSIAGNFSQTLTSLQPNTIYYYRAMAQNSYGTAYGNVLSFKTLTTSYNTCTLGNCVPTAVTTVATNIDNNSARINGLGLVTGSVYTTGYFEWGTSALLGNSTTAKSIGSGSSNPFYTSLFNLNENTTYYYRAVVQNTYGTSRGTIRSFTTGRTIVIDTGNQTGNNNIVYRDTTVVTNITDETAGLSRPSLVFLDVSRDDETIFRGQTVEYSVYYKNVSAEYLKNVVLQVYFPKEFTLLETSRGYFSEDNNAMVLYVGDLYPQAEGSVTIKTRLTGEVAIGEIVVVTANLAYTIVADGAQEEVFAYSKNTVEENLLGLGAAALFGSGFWPNTLIGWILLILLLLIVLWVARNVYSRAIKPIFVTEQTTKK